MTWSSSLGQIWMSLLDQMERASLVLFVRSVLAWVEILICSEELHRYVPPRNAIAIQ